MKILFVEDEPDLSSLAVGQLTALGHSVLTASNVVEANRIFEQHRAEIDLIIADHRLPDGHGIDFILEAFARDPRIKCAVVSGVLTSLDRKVLEEHSIPFFLKPVLYSTVVRDPRLAKMPNSPKISAPVLTAPPPMAPPPPARPPPKKGLTSIIFSKFTKREDLG